MRAFGFLSFGHYGGSPAQGGISARQMLHDAIDIGVGADELGVNNASFRVHHYARQSASPMPLLSAVAARTQRIEVGTGVIDMRYENPLYLAEEAAALDLIADGRVAPRAIEPQSDQLIRHIWWGAGSRATAEWTGQLGLNMMSSTLLTEATGAAFGDLQAEQIDSFRTAFREAGHTHAPRVSVSRSVFPIVTAQDRMLFGARPGEGSDQIGIIDGTRSTFGRTYTGEPDQLIEQLKADAAVQSADTLMLTIPSQAGVDLNLHILQSFAEHVAPALGWKPNTEGPVEGDPVS